MVATKTDLWWCCSLSMTLRGLGDGRREATGVDVHGFDSHWTRTYYLMLSLSIAAQANFPRLGLPWFSMNLGHLIVVVAVAFFLVASYAVLFSAFYPLPSIPVSPTRSGRDTLLITSCPAPWRLRG